MKQITVEATLENIPEVTEFVDRELEAHSCPCKAQMQIDIAIDELFSNIARYAYQGKTGEATVQVELMTEPSAAMITFIDCGVPYNPLKRESPDVTLSAEERKIGGLGIYMVRNSMDEVTYENKDGQNILKIRKNFQQGENNESNL